MIQPTEAVWQAQQTYHASMRDEAYITALNKFERKKK